MQFVHLSDIHYGRSNTDDVVEMFDEINNNYSGMPVVITGDLTQNGSKREIDGITSLIEQHLKDMAVFSVPGNHDYGSVGNVFDPSCKRYFMKKLGTPIVNGMRHYGDNPNLQGILDETDIVTLPWDNTVFIGLDSADPKDREYFAQGFIPRAQINNLTQIFTEFRDYKKVLCFHHHPFARNIFDELFMELVNAEELLDKVGDKIDILLFGHKHKDAKWHNRNNIPFIHAAGATQRPGDYKIFDI